MSNLTLVLHGKKDLRLAEKPTPTEVGPNDVLLKVHSVGICGTDIHFWAHGAMGPFTLKDPHVLGHETSGTILKIGTNVKNVAVGDKVTLEPAIPCFGCTFCRDGENNLCPYADDKVVGSPPYNGCLQRFFVHPAELIHKLPDNMSLEEGALVEPMACVVHSIKRSQITVGQNVLICGAGPIGLLCMLTAKAYGAGKVCITDLNPGRLAHGKQIGADFTYVVERDVDPKTQAAQIIELMGGKPDVTLECTGVESSLQMSLNVTQSGGRVVLVGLGPEYVKVPLCMSSLRQIDIIGSARYNNTFPLAIDLIASGRVDAKSVVTHKFPLEKSEDAFQNVIKGEGSKVLIQC
jgi:L-iditol 2-dehydrogenase